MELKDFITSTIQSIQDSMVELRDNNDEMMINPTLKSANRDSEVVAVKGDLLPVTVVSFDVAVTEASSDKAGGGGGISVLPFKVEGSAELANSSNNTSRIKFDIRVALGTSGNSGPRRQRSEASSPRFSKV